MSYYGFPTISQAQNKPLFGLFGDDYLGYSLNHVFTHTQIKTISNYYSKKSDSPLYQKLKAFIGGELDSQNIQKVQEKVWVFVEDKKDSGEI